MDTTLKFPVTYSLVSSKAIEVGLIPLYNLPQNSKVLFIHQGINDTYLITTSEANFILRIYRANWKTIEEVGAELDLLLLLSDNGLSVSCPLSDKSGKLIQKMYCPEGMRCAVIFSHAPGECLSNLNAENANLFGQYVGHLHNVTANLNLQGFSRQYTVKEVLTSAKRSLQLLMSNTGEVFDRVDNIFDCVERILSKDLLMDIRTGICHGDLHHENLFFEASAGKITLFDFDFCGHGYLIYDLASFCRYERNSPENQANFFEGYEKVRPLNQVEKENLPYFEVLMRVFHLGARAVNADGVKNPKWLQRDIERTVYDIDVQLSNIINAK